MGVVTTAKSKVDQVSLVGSTLSPLTLSDSVVVEGDIGSLDVAVRITKRSRYS